MRVRLQKDKTIILRLIHLKNIMKLNMYVYIHTQTNIRKI